MTELTEAYGFQGRTMLDRDGDKIGKIDDIYEDRQTGQPEWALVHTGLFGTKKTFVPLRGAQPDRRGRPRARREGARQGRPGHRRRRRAQRERGAPSSSRTTTWATSPRLDALGDGQRPRRLRARPPMTR